MRVLLDENLPHDLGSLLPGHEVSTVQGVGWAGVKNGDLPFGVVVIQAKSNCIQDLKPLVADILTALKRVEAGMIQHVGA